MAIRTMLKNALVKKEGFTMGIRKKFCDFLVMDGFPKSALAD